MTRGCFPSIQRTLWRISGALCASGMHHVRALVPKLLDRLVELFELKRLLDDGHGPRRKDFAQDLAVGITGDDDDRKIGIERLELHIDLVSGDVWQLQIEEHEVKLLLLRHGDRFGAGANHETSKVCLLEELLEERLQSGVIIHHEHGGLAGLFAFTQHITVEQAPLDAPASSDLHCWKLSSLHEVIDRRQGDAKVFGGLFDRHKLGSSLSHDRAGGSGSDDD